MMFDRKDDVDLVKYTRTGSNDDKKSVPRSIGNCWNADGGVSGVVHSREMVE